MELVISFLNITFCLSYYLIDKKNLINPITLFHALWGVLFLIFSTRFYFFPQVEFADLDSNVSVYYITFFFLFFIGGVFSKFLFVILPKKENFSSINKKYQYFNLNEKKLYFIKFFAYLSIIFATIAIIQNDFSLSDYLKDGAFIRASLTEDYNPISSIFSLISSYFAWIILPICSLLLLRIKKKRFWMILPFITIFIVSMITIGKYNLILTIAIFFNIWLLTQKLELKTLSKIFKPIGIGFLIIIFIFGASAQIRESTSDEINYSESTFPISFLLFMYGVGHINNFADYYNNYDNDSEASSTENAGFRNISMKENKNFGEFTFSGFYRLLYWVGVKEDVSYTRYEGTKGFNTYSILRNYIDDFGKIGSLFAAFITGFLTNFLFLLANKKKPSGIIFAALIFLFIEYTAIHSLFNFIFFYLVILAAPVIVRLRFGNLSI